MKLALIRRQFSATGGAELYLQRLLGALVARGHEPHLFAKSWSEKQEGVAFHSIAVSCSRALRSVRFAQAVQTKLARADFDCVFSLERTLKQDVYRAGDGMHRVWLEQRRQFAPWWKKPLIGFSAFHRNMQILEAQTFDPANTRHIIVNSDMVKREILRHFPFPPERIHLVRNGVDVPRMQSGKRAETRANFGVRDNEFLLLFVGSGIERKGLRFVLNAHRTVLARLASDKGAGTRRDFAPVKLLIVTRDLPPTRPGGAVVCAGAMKDVENAYAAADLLVFLPIYEPSANVVFEALAAGLPVVTSVFNGAAEILTEGVNGSVLRDFASADAVADALMRWISRRARPVAVDSAALSLERNVTETLRVLELAARERRAEPRVS